MSYKLALPGPALFDSVQSEQHFVCVYDHKYMLRVGKRG